MTLSNSSYWCPASLAIAEIPNSIFWRADPPVEGDDKPALRKFSMVAYTGGAMRLGGWPYPVVVDLAGLRVTRKSRPILKDHDRGSIVGHTDDIKISERSLEVAGVISGVGTTAQEVIATSENGFPWQASLGASADKVVFIPEGKTAKANGRDHNGPLYIARKSTLGEVSFESYPTTSWDDAAKRMWHQGHNRYRRHSRSGWVRWAHTVANNHNKRKGGCYAK